MSCTPPPLQLSATILAAFAFQPHASPLADIYIDLKAPNDSPPLPFAPNAHRDDQRCAAPCD